MTVLLCSCYIFVPFSFFYILYFLAHVCPFSFVCLSHVRTNSILSMLMYIGVLVYMDQ